MARDGEETRSVNLQRWRIEVCLIFAVLEMMKLQMRVVTRLAVVRIAGREGVRAEEVVKP